MRQASGAGCSERLPDGHLCFYTVHFEVNTKKMIRLRGNGQREEWMSMDSNDEQQQR